MALVAAAVEVVAAGALFAGVELLPVEGAKVFFAGWQLVATTRMAAHMARDEGKTVGFMRSAVGRGSAPWQRVSDGWMGMPGCATTDAPE